MVREAVILSAGEGKRMRRDTEDPVFLDTPKPLLNVKGRPIITRNIEKLAEAGFRTTLVVNERDKGRFVEELSAYKLEYCTQQDKGTAGALFAAKDTIKDDSFLVLMGDDISDIDARKLIDLDQPAVFGFEVEDLSSYGALILGENGEVVDILEKQKSGRGLANTGIYIMPKAFFDVYNDIPVDEKSGERFLTHAIRLLREKGFRFKALKLGFWFGINTPGQLKEAEGLLDKMDKT